jgi:hypothetical protein
MARRGVELCREDRWNDGLEILTPVFNASDGKTSSAELPISYLGYLGYGIARYRNKRRDGLALCEHAVTARKRGRSGRNSRLPTGEMRVIITWSPSCGPSVDHQGKLQ